jgi:hypothetical protein
MEWLQTHCLKTKRIFVGIGNKPITIWRQKMVLSSVNKKKGQEILPKPASEDRRVSGVSCPFVGKHRKVKATPHHTGPYDLARY